MIFAVDHPLCDVWNILIGVQDFCWPKFINPLGQKSAFGRFLSCVGIIKPFLDSDPLALSQEEFNNNAIKTEQCINNDVNDSKVKVKSAKKANKRKIETSSDSEDYEEKDLVEDKSDALMKMKNIKPFLNCEQQSSHFVS